MNDDDRGMMAQQEEEGLAEYRSVSRMAVVSLFLGIASILALFHPLSWLIPVVAVLVSFLALRSTASPEKALDGRKAALAGLFLALFFGVAAIGYWALERQVAVRQSRQFVDRFLEILESGDYAKAVECTQSFQYRQPETVPLAEFYAQDESASKLLKGFLEKDVVREIIASEEDADIEFVRVEIIDRPRYGVLCWMRYRITKPDDSSTDFFVAVSRKINPDSASGRPHWFLQSIDLAKEAEQPES